MWLFFVFVAVPIIEIALFIQVGGAIGLWATLGIVILTALAGTALMRAQGVMTLNRLQTSLAEGRNPTDPIAQGAMILVAGVLLLTPGFFTDAIGFSLLLPPVRAFIIRWAAARLSSAKNVHFTTFNSGQASPSRQSSDTIEGDFEILEDENTSPPENPSGWTRPQ